MKKILLSVLFCIFCSISTALACSSVEDCCKDNIKGTLRYNINLDGDCAIAFAILEALGKK